VLANSKSGWHAREAFLGPHRVTLTNEEAPISQRDTKKEGVQLQLWTFRTDEDARKTPKTMWQMETNDERRSQMEEKAAK